MAKNRWYSGREDAYIRRRVKELNLWKIPYGRRSSVYRQISVELYQRFGVKRPWVGIQQRLRQLLGTLQDSEGESF